MLIMQKKSRAHLPVKQKHICLGPCQRRPETKNAIEMKGEKDGAPQEKIFPAPPRPALLSVRFDSVPYDTPLMRPNPHVLCPAPSEKSWSDVESKFQTETREKVK